MPRVEMDTATALAPRGEPSEPGADTAKVKSL
jgi:hypothetical protein